MGGGSSYSTKEKRVWKGAAVGFPRAAFKGPALVKHQQEEGKSVSSQCEGARATKQGDCQTPEASDPAEGKEKRRGKRRRGHTTTEIWCVNTSGKPQLEKAIGAAAGTREQSTHVVAVLNL